LDVTGRPSEPPPKLRADLSDRERAEIVAVVGPLVDDLARPLRDGRGHVFQRLEFLGDSVLDLMLATHAVVEPACLLCASSKGEVGRLVTDRQLARQAEAIGLGSWLEWSASSERLADLVESCVAASWLSGSWLQTTRFASRVVHPLSLATVQSLSGEVLSGPRPVPPHSTGSRGERRLGAALLELAAAWSVFRGHPEADEGELSRLRAAAHQTSRVADFARRTHLALGAGEDAAVSDRVEAWLASKLLLHGADAALVSATGVLK
jgi:dsRNA-specific ribonuclease